MGWAFWRKKPEPPPRTVSRRQTGRMQGAAPAPEPAQEEAAPEAPEETLDEVAPVEEPPRKPSGIRRPSGIRPPTRGPVAPTPDPGASVSAPEATPPGGTPGINRPAERLGDMLVKSGAISPEALEQALDKQRELRADTYLGEILIRDSAIDEEQLADLISKQYRIPLIRMDGHEFKKDLLKLLTGEDAWRLRAIPTDKLGRILSVAMANPLDERAVAELGRITGLKIKPLIAVNSEIRRALDYIYPGRAPSVAPRPRVAPGARSPGEGQRDSNPPATGKFVPVAPDTGKFPAAGPGANTILRRATKAPETSVATTPGDPNGPVPAEAVTEEAFDAATSSNPEYLLRRTPEPRHRRRALAATPVGDAEFALFVGSLSRK